MGGVQSVAETGSLSTLRSEVARAGDSIGSSTSVSGALFLSNDSTTDFTESLEVDEDHSLITSISMIAPSPDWFTGFYDFSPVEDGMWLSSFTIETYAWDAGTDSGITYSSSNQATSPKDNIFQLTPESLPSSKVFLSPDELTVEPVARWSCTMKKEVKEDNAPEVIVTKVAGSTPVGTPISFTCTFDSQWTAATHPIDYPSNAHWSPMFMASHNKDYSMWDSGAKATAGVQSVAKTGSLSTLRSEVAQA